MIDKIKLEDALIEILKEITFEKYNIPIQVHLSNYDYSKVQLKYPRIVVNVDEPQFFRRQSFDTVYKIKDEKLGDLKVLKQFNLDVTIQTLGDPASNDSYELMQFIRGKIGTDYDILFYKEDSSGNVLRDLRFLAVQSFTDIEDISIELRTKIENRWQMVIGMSGQTNIYDGTIERISPE